MIEPITLLMGMQIGRLIAGQRMKTAAPALWETLFEGEVTTEASEFNGYVAIPIFSESPLFLSKYGIRVTINDVSHISTSSVTASNGSYYVGNLWLYENKENTGLEDNGLDYFICTNFEMFGSANNRIFTREPGTYQVKIERALFEPLAYLYNGARAPKLPDIPEDYPYVSMYYHSSLKGMRYLYFSKSPCYMVEGQKNWYVPAPYLKCGLDSAADYNEWKEPTLSDSTEDYKNVLPKWANHDISDPDPDVADNSYITSDPIPVYE